MLDCRRGDKLPQLWLAASRLPSCSVATGKAAIHAYAEEMSCALHCWFNSPTMRSSCVVVRDLASLAVCLSKYDQAALDSGMLAQELAPQDIGHQVNEGGLPMGLLTESISASMSRKTASSSGLRARRQFSSSFVGTSLCARCRFSSSCAEREHGQTGTSACDDVRTTTMKGAGWEDSQARGGTRQVALATDSLQRSNKSWACTLRMGGKQLRQVNPISSS